MSMRRTWRALGGVVIAAAMAMNTAAARADDFVDQVNAPFKQIAKDKRSDLIVLPVLAKMQPAPAMLKSQAHTALLGTEGPGWEERVAWATAPTQKAALDVLVKTTGELDHRKAMVFAQPYGVEGVDLDMVSAGLYTELGETPTLAGATFGYMKALEQWGILIHTEASRLAKEGDPNAAMELLVEWALFTRQFADRAFLVEKTWGVESMSLALERIRDIAYQDYRASAHKVDADRVSKALKRIPPGGILALDRLTLPDGDFIARRQLLNRVLKKGGGVDPVSFGPTMAKINSVDRPLRVFSASAYWNSVGAAHSPYSDTDRNLTGMWEDWKKRWALSPFDQVQQTKSDYVLKVKGRPNFAVLNFSMDSMDQLFNLRERARVEIAGTRMSLAVYAYQLLQKAPPPALNSTRPLIVPQLDLDPYNSRKHDLGYLLIGRDNPKEADGSPKAYPIRVYPPEPYPNFQVNVQPGEFVLYSVGPNNLSEGIQNATQGRLGVSGDFLLWPPAIALYRQRAEDTNQLR